MIHGSLPNEVKRLILYHGSTVLVENPRILKSERGRDFGFAFYTTDIREQAVRWAKRKAVIEKRRTREKIVPIVSCFEWDEKQSRDSLIVKQFQEPDLEWLDLVVKCRSDIFYQHEYDIIIGKIANDNVGETVSYVLQGIMRKEDAVERLRFERINNQIAFCTEKSLNSLSYKEYFIAD